MNFTSNFIIDIYSIMLLTIIYIYSLRHKDVDSLQDKLYMLMIQVTIFSLVMDIFSRFDGNPGTFYTIFNYMGNFFIFLTNLTLPSLWLLYARYQVFHEERNWMYQIRMIWRRLLTESIAY